METVKPVPYSEEHLRAVLEGFRDKTDQEILGVSWNAEPGELKAAWKRFAEKYHPDNFDMRLTKSVKRALLLEIHQRVSEAYRRLRHGTQSVELIPPPDKIGSWKDPIAENDSTEEKN